MEYSSSNMEDVCQLQLELRLDKCEKRPLVDATNEAYAKEAYDVTDSLSI